MTAEIRKLAEEALSEHLKGDEATRRLHKLAREVLAQGEETWRITASELVTIMDTHLYVAQRGPDDEYLDEPCVAGFGEATLAILNRLTQTSAPVKEGSI